MTRLRLHALALIPAVAGLLMSSVVAAADPPLVTVSADKYRATVNIDGKLFTEYRAVSGTRPVLWPVIGPTGKPMTRSFPVGPPQRGESNDHIHHRSFWFGYEGLNEVDYWHEPEVGVERPFPLGREEHREFAKIENDGHTALVVARTDYLDAQLDKVCEDERTMRFGADSQQRWIDFKIKLIASEGPLHIGDSKEGVFALRVASTMKVEAGLGGQIVTSRGLTDAEAWGLPAEWCDYHGPVDDQTVGIAILVHPSSFRPTPRWHVRPYGLFGVNPFGQAAFSADRNVQPNDITVPEGDSLVFRYRVIFHRGDHEDAHIAEAFTEYASN